MSGGNRKDEKRKSGNERRRRGGLDFSSRFPRTDLMREIVEEEKNVDVVIKHSNMSQL
jgi:hypothetical protein